MSVQPDTPWVPRQRAFAVDERVVSYLLVEKADVVTVVVGRRRDKTSKTGKPMTWLQNDAIWRFSARSGRLVVLHDSFKGSKLIHRRDATATATAWSLLHAGDAPGLKVALIRALRALSIRTLGYEPPEPTVEDSAEPQPLVYQWSLQRGPDPLDTLVWDMAYPFLRGRLTEPSMAPRAGIAPALRSTTARDAAVALFGKRRARRDVIRATGAATPTALALAHHVRTAVPTDWLAELLTNIDVANTNRRRWDELGSVMGRYGRELREMSDLLRAVPITRRRKFLMTLASEPHAFDACRQWSQLEDRTGADFTSWSTLHDSLSNLLWRQRNEDHPIPQSPFYDRIDGAEVIVRERSLVVRSPKSTDEVREWGQVLSHCIGSYADEALCGRTLLAAVFDDDALYATAEIDPGDGSTRQLYARFNTPLPSDEHDLLARVFADAHATAKKTAAAAA